MCNGNARRRKTGTRERCRIIITENLPKIMSGTDPESWDTKPGKCWNTTLRHIIFKLQKMKDKEKNPEISQRKENVYF